MLKEENCHVADEKTEYLGDSPNDTRLLRNCFPEPGSPDSQPSVPLFIDSGWNSEASP